MNLFRKASSVFLAGMLLGATDAQAQDYLREVRALPAGRQMHGAAVLGDYLYVFGGTDAGGRPTTTVQKARIEANGLGAWEASTSLPGPRIYVGNSTLVLNDIVYIVGGSIGVVSPENQDTVVFTVSDHQGLLAPWRLSPRMPDGGRAGAAAVSTPGRLHVIGGLAKGGPLAATQSINVLPDGSLGSWEKGPDLPVGLWYHHAAVAGGRVVVWGGLTKNDNVSVTDIVYTAEVLGNGRLGPFRTESTKLPVPFYAASVAVAGPYLISLSPRFRGSESSPDFIWSFMSDEGVGNWTRSVTQVPLQIYHAAATDYRRGTVYLIGGRRSKNDRVILPTCIQFNLSPQARQSITVTGTPTGGGNGAGELIQTTTAGSESVRALEWQTRQERPPEFVDGFTSLDRAIYSGRPFLVYFHLAGSTLSATQAELFSTPEFREILATTPVAWVDAKSNPQYCQQVGVVRIPAWKAYRSNGELAGTVNGRADLAQIRELVGRVGGL